MKRVIIACVSFCLFGWIISASGMAVAVSHEGGDRQGSAARAAPPNGVDQSYLHEIYTAVPPPQGQEYTPDATRKFPAGEYVCFVARYHSGINAEREIYVLVTNNLGQIVFLDYYQGNVPAGDRVFWSLYDGLPPGSYHFNFVQIGPTGHHIMCSEGFPFNVD